MVCSLSVIIGKNERLNDNNDQHTMDLISKIQLEWEIEKWRQHSRRYSSMAKYQVL